MVVLAALACLLQRIRNSDQFGVQAAIQAGSLLRSVQVSHALSALFFDIVQFLKGNVDIVPLLLKRFPS